jgi:hypothetical protein
MSALPAAVVGGVRFHRMYARCRNTGGGQVARWRRRGERGRSARRLVRFGPNRRDPTADVCEDFRSVPIAEIVRFEVEFPAILRARGFSREAELVTSYRRLYWGAFRKGRLYILGSLVCSERLTPDGQILLVPICPLIRVTFPAGYPQHVEFLVGG